MLSTLLSLTSVFIACAARLSEDASERLRQQLDEDWTVLDEPISRARDVGRLSGQNARWTDYSAAAIDARAAYLRKSVLRLDARSTARGSMRPISSTTTCIANLLETAVDGLAFHNDAMPIRGVIPHNLLMPINQMEASQQDIPRIFALMPAATRRRLRGHRRAARSGSGRWSIRRSR